MLAAMLPSLMSHETITDYRDRSFPQQDRFVNDMSRLICAQTTVRAGKTTGLALKYFRAGHKYQNVMMPYAALTRDSAKNIMWPILKESAERLKIQCDFTDYDLTCHIKKTGSSIKLFGADMKNFIDRFKGIKTPFAAVDEGQSFRSHLEELIDILTARTSEYADGQVAVTGTPGAIPMGYFYDISQGLHGFNVHKWSLFDNPYFPTAKAFVDELKERKKWADNHPTLLREYYGQWVQDFEALVLHYNAAINDFDQQPDLTDFIVSVDIGHDDADAIAVIGWHRNHKKCYLVEEYVQAQQGITELAQAIEKRIKHYNPLKVVMDTGGLGKKIAKELNMRFSLPIVAAEKSRKIEYLALLDDAMRMAKFFARKGSRFAQDTLIVEWDYDKSTSDKLVIKDEPHSDIVDAALYGFREAQHWLAEPAKEVVNYNNRSQYLKHTEKLMEEALEREILADKAKENEADMFALMEMDMDENPLKHYLNKRRA